MGNSESLEYNCSASSLPSTEPFTSNMSEKMEEPIDVAPIDENKENAQEESKELVIACHECSGFVEIQANHTLSDVRSLIMDEFDDDMIPDEGDFYFSVDGIRLSAKQESRRMAWDLQEKNRISIHSKRKKQRVQEEDTVEEEEEEHLTGEMIVREESAANKEEVSRNDPTNACEEQPEGGSEVDSKQHQMEDYGAAENSDSEDADIESARRLLNFDGRFPFDRHSSEERVSEEKSESEPDRESTVGTVGFDAVQNDSVEVDATRNKTDDSAQSDPRAARNPTVEESTSNTGTSTAEAESADIPMDVDVPEDPLMVPKRNTTEEVASTKDSTGEEPVTMDAEVNTTLDVVMTLETDEEEDIVHVEQPSTDAHKIHDEALKNSCEVLKDIKTLLADNPLFCSEHRREEWTAEITESLSKSAPNVVIGVLGNTGVGKSSLLNAILEEASVLPTSGSRGCTAAVVELRFNKDLKEATEEVPVYKGEVEFITLGEWAAELKILIDECSTVEEKTIYARKPEEERQPDAAAAWAKINEVYGRGTMEQYTTHPAQAVYNRLINDLRVKRLLTPQEGSVKPHNSIIVQEGKVEPEKAALLLQAFCKIGSRLRRAKKKWAQSFRSKINDYVYRKGNGDLAQTWPLIRKVVLEGPWMALNTGACLVDLPGVRDANAARAKVSEQYLQNCHRIWVVAPIKRAVDDGTAKELLGESFKRRLLMDGQYGNVSFICTQTDDCEATEIMRDHQDVAILKPGRWERMCELRDKIMSIEKDFADLIQEEEDLKIEYEEADLSAKEAKEELDEETKEAAEKEDDDEDGSDDDDDDVQVDLEALKKSVDEKTEAANQAALLLTSWQAEHKEKMQRMQDNIRTLQRRLKAICATVRNEYSTASLQEDFRAGLKELCRTPDEEETEGGQESLTSTPLPEDFNMDVYCISANDYLKIEGIKPSSDGPPNTFSKVRDTQIPSLQAFVHKTTAKFRDQFTETFVNTTSDMVDRVKLLAADASNVPGGRTSRRCQSLFETEMKKLEAMVRPIAQEFKSKSEARINSSLQPALKVGAVKGQSAAMTTVTSWGSKSRRTKNERDAKTKNGLYYSTYLATVRRDGAYVSKSAGEIDFNQELCDPMEKEFGRDWQSVLDTSLKVFLRDSEAKVLALASSVDKAIVSGFSQSGLDKARLASMAGTASRSCTSALKASFQTMMEIAKNSQRELNRSLLPMVQDRMKQGYSNTTYVQGGPGKFMRMKDALEGHAQVAVQGMFSESTKELLGAINAMITRLSSMIAASANVIAKSMESVYSVCWDDQSDKAALVDPAMQQKVRECRDKLLPDLNQLRQKQDETMRLVGIEREELELDVMEVASWEKQNAEKLQKAIENNELIDLCDSDDEDSNVARMPPIPASSVRIKPDPGASGNTVTPSLSTLKPSGTQTRFV